MEVILRRQDGTIESISDDDVFQYQSADPEGDLLFSPVEYIGVAVSCGLCDYPNLLISEDGIIYESAYFSRHYNICPNCHSEILANVHYGGEALNINLSLSHIEYLENCGSSIPITNKSRANEYIAANY